jgi:hypothetical protein
VSGVSVVYEGGPALWALRRIEVGLTVYETDTARKGGSHS